MEIRTIGTKIMDALKSYHTVDICMIEGLSFPVLLRQKTLDRFVADEIFHRKCYDVSMKNSRHYDNYTEEFHVRKPRHIIDAGGNIGLAAIFFAIQFPDAQIVSIEPDEDNFLLLCVNTEPYANIKAIKGAVWDKQTVLFITNRENAVWADGTLNAGKYSVGGTNTANEPAVYTVIIDEIIRRYNMDKVDILKMDVEGAEREIFSGQYSEWLPKVKILILEHHDFYKPGAAKAVFKAICDYDFHFLYDNSDSLETMMFLFDAH